MKNLTLEVLKQEAKVFSINESKHEESAIYSTSDGKAIGTYIEHKFKDYLSKKYTFIKGSSASGIDFPDELINTDIKITNINLPQSSCPFKSARQKIFGLGYNLLIFIYKKLNNDKTRKSRLDIIHTIFVEKELTGDYQMTSSILAVLENNGNKEDLISIFYDKNLPIDEIEAEKLAEEIMHNKPQIGYLTISNALQWRLQYSRLLEKAGNIDGIYRIL
jgi:hypothetical protein